MRYKVIVFDFDGTLVNSKQVKIDAYYEAFSFDRQEHEAILTKTLEEYPDLNRYDTIQKVIARTNTTIAYDSVLGRYNTIVDLKISTAPFLDFAYEILSVLHTHQVKLFLSSNTPMDILGAIADAKNIHHFFEKLSGYPRDKTANLREIMAHYPYEAGSYLVVGDGESDKMSAHSNDVDFFAVSTLSLKALANYLNIDVGQRE